MRIQKIMTAARSLTVGAVLIAGTAFAAHAAEPALASRARAVLTHALAKEKAFVKVHAAEALIALGEPELPRRAFRAELPAASEVRPYRIGVWRVLAAASATGPERAEWLAQIEAVALDASALDRLHAMETLGKLGHAVSGPVRAAAESMARSPEAEAMFPRWVLHLAGDPTALPGIVAGLESTNATARLRAAYVLRRVHASEPRTLGAVARLATREPTDSIGYAIIRGTALSLNADPNLTATWVGALEQILANGSAGARYDACQILMQRYTTADLNRLAPLLEHPEGDARIGAAWAILHVTLRTAAALPAGRPASTR